jgi:hypothetical protein
VGCRVVANLLASNSHDANGMVEHQAIAALAAALGVRAFTQSWRLSIEGGDAVGSIVFTVQGPDFSRQFRYAGPSNQVGRFIETQLIAALPR